MHMKKVIVALSGGVDSAVTAASMIEKGYDVMGVTLHLYDGQEQSLEDAEKVAKHLNIPFAVGDYREFFKNDVISYFVRTYMQGKTPNPCVHCNRNGKFDYLVREMLKYSADYIAAGHYAKVIRLNDDQIWIARGDDLKKDQSYYLCLLQHMTLKRLLLPMGDLQKEEVRKKAEELGLHVSDKKDSQDVCFLMDEDYREYLERKIDKNRIKKGNFIYEGKVMKEHDGIIYYTVGQRRGLNIGYHEPLFVKHVDPKSGDVFLSKKEEVIAKGVRIHDCEFPDKSKLMFRGHAKLRYRMDAEPCMIEIKPEGEAVILFDEPQFAPTPGQIACVYRDNLVIGGGYIGEIF